MKKKLTLSLRRVYTAADTVKKKAMLLFFTFFAVFFTNLNAQEKAQPGGGGGTDQCDATCLGNVLNISTGYNQTTNTYNTPLAYESNWTLVGTPIVSPVTLPAPCYDIVPYPVWNSCPNADWVSPFQNSAYIINNWPTTAGAWEFQKCFCVCKATTVTISFDMLVDDGAEVLLDGTPIASAFSGYQFWWANRLTFSQSFSVAAGQHCLSVKLYNSGNVAMGFALEGTVSGADLLTSSCCNPYASICGTKLQDVNCDGTVDPTVDPGLPGWTINLYDNLGHLIGTAVTDAVGDYCFTGLHPGTYTVSEVAQAGWVQTYPGGAGTYTITVNAGEVGHAVFGNCSNPQPPDCSFRLDFDGSVINCGINMLAGVSGIPPGYQVISYAWTYGDGTGGNTQYGIHYYNAPGTYTVCLTVTIFNGEQCCTKTVCKDIKIEKACDQGCHFEATENITFNPDNCVYTFNAYVTYAGSPITGWLWDYGDGTTGLGSTTTHQYSHPGVYTVCLTLFSQQGDQCCFTKFCREINVEDCRAKNLKSHVDASPTKVVDQANPNMIVLNQNAPNPFAENTVINYDIPASFSKAMISIVDLNGIVVKTFNITEKGKGQLTVFGNNLTNGMYMYSLIVDGKVIASKRMVKN